jgi:group I intron endonuclease
LAVIPRTYVVYLINNKANGKVYIGKTFAGSDRWKTHLRTARGGPASPKFKRIHRAIAKYGEANFSFAILSSHRDETDAYAAEEAAVAFFMSDKPENGYNVESGGWRRKFNPESVRRKIAERLRGRTLPPEVIEKIVAKTRGSKRSPETKARMSQAHKGHVVSEEQRRAISRALTGRKIPRDIVEKAAAGHRGRHHSEEAKRKIRDAQKGRPLKPEHVAKLRGKKRTPEQCERIRLARWGNRTGADSKAQ